MAPAWLAEKATLPPYDPPLTPEGVPDLQGVWGAPGGDGLSYLEDHEYIDVTTPAQETFISDPPDGRVPYTPWAMARRNEILAGLARGWPGESGERLYASPNSYCLYFMPEFSFEEVEIVQQPGKVIMLGANGYRVIPTDARPPFDENAKFWFGISRGRWGGRHADRGGDQSQRQELVSTARGTFFSEKHAHDRAVEAGGRGYDRLRDHDRGPDDLCQAMEDELSEEAPRHRSSDKGRSHTRRGFGGRRPSSRIPMRASTGKWPATRATGRARRRCAHSVFNGSGGSHRHRDGRSPVPLPDASGSH